MNAAAYLQQCISIARNYEASLLQESKEENMNEKLHQELLDYIHKLYITKNKDYGSSVHDTYIKYGFPAYLIRIEDKLNRARIISKNPANVTDEKLEDTLLDLANYAILAAMELRGEK